jgi:hypothetical protein
MSALSLETKIQDSPFLRLPGEIRNQIYNLVLKRPDKTLLHSASSTQPWNEFQYVCRQLHHETKTLHLELNPNLKLVSTWEEPFSARRRFFKFFTGLPMISRALVCNVDLCSGTGMPSSKNHETVLIRM